MAVHISPAEARVIPFLSDKDDTLNTIQSCIGQAATHLAHINTEDLNQLSTILKDLMLQVTEINDSLKMSHNLMFGLAAKNPELLTHLEKVCAISENYLHNLIPVCSEAVEEIERIKTKTCPWTHQSCHYEKRRKVDISKLSRILANTFPHESEEESSPVLSVQESSPEDLGLGASLQETPDQRMRLFLLDLYGCTHAVGSGLQSVISAVTDLELNQADVQSALQTLSESLNQMCQTWIRCEDMCVIANQLTEQDAPLKDEFLYLMPQVQTMYSSLITYEGLVSSLITAHRPGLNAEQAQALYQAFHVVFS